MNRSIELRQLLIAGALGAAVSGLIIWIPAHGHVRNATFGDGVLYRYVASHLNAYAGQPGTLTPEDLPIRYGRVGLPAMMWLLSGGSRAAMFYVQPILMMASGAVAAAATHALLRGSIVKSLAPFAALGLSTSIAGGFAEALAIALSLFALVLIRQNEWLAATVCLAAAILAKESSLVVLAGILIWQFRKREFRSLLLVASVVPYLLWAFVVAHRFGTFPWQDPWWKSHAFGTPFVAFWRTLSVGGSGAVLAAVHAGLVIIALLICRRGLSGTIALVASVPIFVTAPGVWRYTGDALRAVSFFEVFLIIAVLEYHQSRATWPAASQSSPANLG
jgi:hypothetical protein